MSPSSASRLPSGFLRTALPWLCALCWVLSAVATHLPPGQAGAFHVNDKLLHAVGYFTLGVLLLGTLAVRGVSPAQRAWIALTVLLLYGIADELTQPLVGRDAAVADYLADAAGTTLAVLLDQFLAWQTGRKANRQKG